MKSAVRVVLLIGCLAIGAGCASSASTPPPSQAPQSAGAPSASPVASTAPAATPATATAEPTAASPAPTSKLGCKPAPDKITGMSVLECTVAAPSLANNLLNDPAELEIDILLPAGYKTSGKKYPSVYVLAGWNDNAAFLAYQFGGGVKTAPPATSEAIYVLVGGENPLGGSFYVNSPVSGNWEDAIANDLVAFIDGAYRTIPAAASRGMAGHSMGGFGALSIAMHRPDVFGAVYALSPGLFGASGPKARLGDEAVFAPLVTAAGELAGKSTAERVKGILDPSLDDFDVAYGAAFVPDPAAPALMKLPYKSDGSKLVLDAAVWKQWEAGFGGISEKLATYGSRLKQLRAIGVDYGLFDEYDWIPEGCKAFVSQATKAGIKVTESTFEGDHQGSLDSRIADFMIPFFAKHLAR